MRYTNVNQVINKIAKRLPKLTAYTENMSDFSIARMTDRIANSVCNFEKTNDIANAYNVDIYPLDVACKNFDASSRDFAAGDAGASVDGFEGVRGVDVVDMTLIATVQSMLPHLAVDFGMQKPTDVLAYQALVAVDNHGTVKEGDSVVNPYKPLNPNATSSMLGVTLDSKTSAAGAVDLGAPVARGTVRVTLQSGVVGEDVKGDGNIYFMGVSDVSATVDYLNGIVTITGTPSGELTITANPDMSSENDGANTLRLKPVMKKITVDAVQHAINLENNIESISFMNKQITGKNYGEIATRQFLDAFIYTLNSEVVSTTYKLANEQFPSTSMTIADVLDLSSYYNGTFTNFAVTKDDRILEYLARLEGEMYARSNKGFTYILCGNNAARVFKTMSRFTAVPQRLGMMDGVIGYLDLGMDAKVAVVRHQIMDTADANFSIAGSNGKYGNIILGYRDPMGVAAPVGYFEYLPIVSSRVALNWKNPTQFSQSVFNYSATSPLIKEYVARGAFRLSSN